DVTAEPHLSPIGVPTTAPAEPLPGATVPVDSTGVSSVWDEPTTARELAGAPDARAITYASWLTERSAQTSELKSWWIVLLVSLAAGPWAIIGAFAGSFSVEASVFTLLAAVFVAPVVEEITKVAIAQTVLETRPYLFKRFSQLLIVGLAGGLSFATIENLIYLNVYIPDPTPALVVWRWTVCVALHMSCSLIASIGLAIAWRDGMRNRRRPKITDAMPWIVIAMIVHGAYNAFAVALSIAGFEF
ncbi:MAG TPA: PrsW family glutamic-type intramembrane protease, partial [Tepidisphaeraceae bacterium]|nr:PrsW family glutamic-type intramembrane protease [Tepidisphaeraceae bacterium]